MLLLPVVLALRESLDAGSMAEQNLFTKEALLNGTERVHEPATWDPTTSLVLNALGLVLGFSVLYARHVLDLTWGRIFLTVLWWLDACITAIVGLPARFAAFVAPEFKCERTALRRAKARGLHRGKKPGPEISSQAATGSCSEESDTAEDSSVACGPWASWLLTAVGIIKTPEKPEEAKARARGRGGRSRARGGKGGKATAPPHAMMLKKAEEEDDEDDDEDEERMDSSTSESDHSTSSPESSSDHASSEEPIDSDGGQVESDCGEASEDSESTEEEALGEKLYPLVYEHLDLSGNGCFWRQPGNPEADCMGWVAAKVTGMLLENEQAMIEVLLASPAQLQETAMQAAEALQQWGLLSLVQASPVVSSIDAEAADAILDCDEEVECKELLMTSVAEYHDKRLVARAYMSWKKGLQTKAAAAALDMLRDSSAIGFWGAEAITSSMREWRLFTQRRGKVRQVQRASEQRGESHWNRLQSLRALRSLSHEEKQGRELRSRQQVRQSAVDARMARTALSDLAVAMPQWRAFAVTSKERRAQRAEEDRKQALGKVFAMRKAAAQEAAQKMAASTAVAWELSASQCVNAGEASGRVQEEVSPSTAECQQTERSEQVPEDESQSTRIPTWLMRR
jgi:hypothetical protein